MTELDFKTLDLAAVLSGIGFPESEVEVFFDERPGYAVRETLRKLREAEVRDDRPAVEALDKELAELRRKARSVRYTVALKGMPESTRKTCDAQAREEHPVTYNFIGQPEPNPEKNDLYETLLWTHSIVSITDPSGAVGHPSAQWVKDLRSQAGRTVIETINKGVLDLVDASKEGFEDAVRDVDFLSDASPEG